MPSLAKPPGKMPSFICTTACGTPGGPWWSRLGPPLGNSASNSPTSPRDWPGGPAYRLRALEERDCANLLRHSARQRGLHLGEEVIAYLLKRCPREPDYLLKLLGRLDEATLAHKRRPTLPLIRALIEGPPT
jgi:hypothetical protein